MKDTLLLAAERLLRQIYWSSSWLRRWKKKHQARISFPIQTCEREQLLERLGKIGVVKGSLVMAHTSINGLQIVSLKSDIGENPVAQAQSLLDDLLMLVGSDGTLVMPTHDKNQTGELEMEGQQKELTVYDPRRTPCGVGLVNELFWRRNGVKRSLFPFNMVAASGPLADELLRDNLNERKPSPHGMDSGYYRFCLRNGLVVSIGVPLRECITIAHVVEEVRADWPIEDFFIERSYQVVQAGVAKEWTVRLRRDEYAKFCYCRKKMGQDLVAEGVIHEGSVGTARVDWARAGEVYEFFQRKTAKPPYPYYGLWMMRKPWRKES